MGKPVLIKDKKQEVFDRAQSTASGRKLIKKIELWKDNVNDIIELADEIRELAKEADLSVEDTKILAVIVFDKVPWSNYYKRKAMDIFNPRIKEPNYNKLAMKALMHDPMKSLSDKQLYEGDYELFIPYTAINKRQIMHMAKGNEGWYLRIRNGKPQNVKNDLDEEWMILENYEIEADLTRKELESMI